MTFAPSFDGEDGGDVNWTDTVLVHRWFGFFSSDGEHKKSKNSEKRKGREKRKKRKKNKKNEMLTRGYKTPLKIDFQNTLLKIGNSPFLFF